MYVKKAIKVWHKNYLHLGNGYLLNAFVYLGQDSDGQNLTQEPKRLSKPTQAVFVYPIENSDRNVTAENWFSSIELVNMLTREAL